ncbi:MAG: glycosyltransferase family 2 protein [Candidatus Omnitrophota bacterium]
MMVSVIIPVYNEEKNLQYVISSIKSALKGNFELLIINDGSTDKSADIIRNSGAVLVNQPYRMGNGAAIKRGIREAKGDILVFMDGDGQHKAEDIHRLLEHIEEFDMVVGARTNNSNMCLHRRLANKIYNWLASYVTSFRIEDLTCGFRAIKKTLALKFVYLLPNTFSYPTTLTLAVLKTGRSIKYIPITTTAREGKSKINTIYDGAGFLLILFKIATLFSPFKIFLPISILFFILGLINYAYTFFTAHRFTSMSALLFTTSAIIFMLSLVSEQISLLRMQHSEDNRE